MGNVSCISWVGSKPITHIFIRERQREITHTHTNIEGGMKMETEIAVM